MVKAGVVGEKVGGGGSEGRGTGTHNGVENGSLFSAANLVKIFLSGGVTTQIVKKLKARQPALARDAPVDGAQHGFCIVLGCLYQSHDLSKQHPPNRKNNNAAERARYFAENPLPHDFLPILAVHGIAEEGLDLLVVEALEVSTTQKGVVGGDGACVIMWAKNVMDNHRNVAR